MDIIGLLFELECDFSFSFGNWFFHATYCSFLGTGYLPRERKKHTPTLVGVAGLRAGCRASPAGT